MQRQNRRMMFVALGALAAGAGAGGEPPSLQAQAEMPSFARLVRLYDFEEAEQAPYVMPINFYRHEAPQQGFPRFGRTHLTRDAAHGGNWSFGFELDGGSLSARIPTAVLPVLPGSDYRVTAWIRTDGLTHSRARLSAWLNDDAGNPVEIHPGMTFFLHMILMDSDHGLAMAVGESVLVGASGCERLSAASLDLVVN